MASALINGGTLEYGAASDADVTLEPRPAARFMLDASTLFTGTVAGFRGQETLELTDIGFGGSSAAYDSGTGVLTVTDVDSDVAHIVLSGVYQNAVFAIADSSGHAKLTVDVASIADLNGVTAGSDVEVFAAEQTSVLLAPSATITDIDSSTLASMTLTLTTRPDGSAEQLSLNAAAATAASNAGLTVSAYNPATGVLLISGTAALSVYETILRGIQYNDSSDATTTADRTVTVVVNDGVATSVTHTVTVDVTAVNDAPVSTNDSVTTNEDTAKVLALTDFGTYSDVEVAAIAAVKITTLESDGDLQYDTTGSGSWTSVTLDQEISAADITAGRLRFVPDANKNGGPYATIGFKVSDGTDFSANAYTLTVNVTAVNDAPVITSGGGATASVSILENRTAVTTVTAADPEGAPTFSIVGGDDQALFIINPTTGALAFIAAPNFEAPADVSSNNMLLTWWCAPPTARSPTTRRSVCPSPMSGLRMAGFRPRLAWQSPRW